MQHQTSERARDRGLDWERPREQAAKEREEEMMEWRVKVLELQALGFVRERERERERERVGERESVIRNYQDRERYYEL